MRRRSYIIADPLFTQKIRLKYWWRIVKNTKCGTKKVESFWQSRNIFVWSKFDFKSRISTNGDYSSLLASLAGGVIEESTTLNIWHNWCGSNSLLLERCPPINQYISMRDHWNIKAIANDCNMCILFVVYLNAVYNLVYMYSRLSRSKTARESSTSRNERLFWGLFSQLKWLNFLWELKNFTG